MPCALTAKYASVFSTWPAEVPLISYSPCRQSIISDFIWESLLFFELRTFKNWETGIEYIGAVGCSVYLWLQPWSKMTKVFLSLSNIAGPCFRKKQNKTKNQILYGGTPVIPVLRDQKLEVIYSYVVSLRPAMDMWYSVSKLQNQCLLKMLLWLERWLSS